MGSTEGIPCSTLLVHGFTLPIKLSLSQPTSFLHFFYTSDSLPHAGVEEWLSGFVGLSQHVLVRPSWMVVLTM